MFQNLEKHLICFIKQISLFIKFIIVFKELERQLLGTKTKGAHNLPHNFERSAALPDRKNLVTLSIQQRKEPEFNHEEEKKNSNYIWR